MNIVEPIKSIEDIQNIKRVLSKKPRNALLFSFGINSGLRIADILSLDVKDVKGNKRNKITYPNLKDNLPNPIL